MAKIREDAAGRGGTLDSIDRAIVRLLYANGRLSREQLGREVHLSRPAVHERVKRLEEQGVIRGYRALVDWAALGQPLTAFVFARTTGPTPAESLRALVRLPRAAATVEECHFVTGEWCILLKVRAASPAALQDLLGQICEVAGVQSTMTTLVLSTLWDARVDAGRATPTDGRAAGPAREAPRPGGSASIDATMGQVRGIPGRAAKG